MRALRANVIRLAAVAATLALGACSSGSSLTTSALFGGGSDKPTAPDAPPAPQTMQDRVVHVATTAARAQRCGFVFDPMAVRQSYVAFEGQQGGATDQSKAEQSYDYTFSSVAKRIMADPDYCTDGQTAVIKRDLGKVLAGDFSASGKKSDSGGGWFGAQPSAKPMDRDKIFDPIVR